MDNACHVEDKAEEDIVIHTQCGTAQVTLENTAQVPEVNTEPANTSRRTLGWTRSTTLSQRSNVRRFPSRNAKLFPN